MKDIVPLLDAFEAATDSRVGRRIPIYGRAMRQTLDFPASDGEPPGADLHRRASGK
jgi:hypothetical protein